MLELETQRKQLGDDMEEIRYVSLPCVFWGGGWEGFVLGRGASTKEETISRGGRGGSVEPRRMPFLLQKQLNSPSSSETSKPPLYLRWLSSLGRSSSRLCGMCDAECATGVISRTFRSASRLICERAPASKATGATSVKSLTACARRLAAQRCIRYRGREGGVGGGERGCREWRGVTVRKVTVNKKGKNGESLWIPWTASSLFGRLLARHESSFCKQNQQHAAEDPCDRSKVGQQEA